METVLEHIAGKYSNKPDDNHWPNYFLRLLHDLKQRCSRGCRDFDIHYFGYHLLLLAPGLSAKPVGCSAGHQLDRKIHLSCHLPAAFHTKCLIAKFYVHFKR